MARSKEDILKLIDENEIKYIRLWFTDILGRLKGISITRSEIEAVLDHGQGFDGSSIEGFVRIEESDLNAIADLDTFTIFPWNINSERVALLFCDIQTPDGKPYEGDSRYILKRMLDEIARDGYTVYLGPEMEYFYFKSSQSPEIIDHGGYFDYATVDESTKMRKKTVTALESIGIQVECSHHEVAPSQQEIDLKYQDALRMADFSMIYRLVVKEIALAEGYYATFMPKPIFGENGSGMHVHQSLFKNGRNAFFSKDDTYNLSDIAKSYIAGLLKHIKEICLVTNQWVNSYKRLVPNYEAPVYISWGRRNRSSLVRVPMYRVGREEATRVELRSPDPACNPYLAFAVMIAAGYEGVRNGYKLEEPIEANIFSMDQKKRKRLRIDTLPGSLENAISEFKKSRLMKRVLGDHIFEKLIDNKIVEWDQYRIAVTGYEIDNYFPVL
ncbi:MAG: type I glutamate--ammonia ligase [candidate division Zixibacteria bacterium 4484_95]|nr:MAG: type I glutamate--ammonia ligase [candidate division Zixibacteria bacterium 4484_95]